MLRAAPAHHRKRLPGLLGLRPRRTLACREGTAVTPSAKGRHLPGADEAPTERAFALGMADGQLWIARELLAGRDRRTGWEKHRQPTLQMALAHMASACAWMESVVWLPA